jgi:hypothetical protein
MSYILEALKKAERERELAQFIDYENNESKNKRKFSLQTHYWLWISVLLIMNVLSFTTLLWPKEPIAPPRVYIVSPQ